MSMAVETLPISHAAQALGFPEALLRHLVVAGVIAGDTSTCDLDQAAQVVARLRAAQKLVAGHPILISEVAKKYGFHSNSVYNWINGGWVQVLQPEPRIKVDEGDIAFTRVLADLVGHVPGRAIFPAKSRSGRPRKSAV
ncbi:MAG: hypothetical protein WCJ55_05420 [Chloroflexales bacterium]